MSQLAQGQSQFIPVIEPKTLTAPFFTLKCPGLDITWSPYF